MKYEFRLNNETIELDATRRGDALFVTLPNGTTHELTVLKQEGGRMTLKSGDRQIALASHRAGNKRQIWVDGGRQASQTVAYERIQQGATADSAETAGSLSATIPAVVTDVLVAVGDAVSAGDKLILLESMKMVIPIAAPQDGTVSALNCAVGDSVQPGVALLEIE